MSAPRMPVLFIGHGSPMNALEDNAWTNQWERLGRELPRPRAILCLSAHWVTRGHLVSGNERPPTIHDFYGFPRELFEVAYPAPGSPSLAARVCELLPGQAAMSGEWGLDHGAWSVLKRMYPAADIPVVQLSLDLSLDAAAQQIIGERLQALREEGILILGSGNVVHNLREISPGRLEPFPWARAFGEAVHARLTGEGRPDLRDVRDFEGYAPAVNSSEHFVPLLNILGAADENDRVTALNHDFLWGSLSMTCYLFEHTIKETI